MALVRTRNGTDSFTVKSVMFVIVSQNDWGHRSLEAIPSLMAPLMVLMPYELLNLPFLPARQHAVITGLIGRCGLLETVFYRFLKTIP